jgi:hypothetical protein
MYAIPDIAHSYRQTVAHTTEIPHGIGHRPTIQTR